MQTDNDGATALFPAVHAGHEAVAKLLLDHRADVAAAQNNGGSGKAAVGASCRRGSMQT